MQRGKSAGVGPRAIKNKPHAHWQHIYRTKADREVSWFEPVPEVSLQLMEAAGLNAETCVLDAGGGDSRLVDELLARGLRCVAVLDISEAALERAQQRLGQARSIPRWIIRDVTQPWTTHPVDIWHDRAVFHFLTDPADRVRYIDRMTVTVKPGGSVIIGTFDLEGPATCSGLPVMRYSPAMLAETVGDRFELVQSAPHLHHTPWGSTQSFQYSRFRRRD